MNTKINELIEMLEGSCMSLSDACEELNIEIPLKYEKEFSFNTNKL